MTVRLLIAIFCKCWYRKDILTFLICLNFTENVFNWKQFVWHSEVEEDCWSKFETNTNTTIFSGAHFSEVDAVIMTRVNKK